MEEQNKESLESKKSFVSRVRLLIKDWDIKVMSYVMLVIVMIATIAATVAWFYYFDVVAVSGIGLTTASTDSLRLEIQKQLSDGQVEFIELNEEDDDIILAYLDMPLFDNVENYEITVGDEGEPGEAATQKNISKMAPGVYGSLTIRLTPLRKEINHYKIYPQAIFDYMDSLTVITNEGVPVDEQPDANIMILQKLLKGHILFFENRIEREKTQEGSLLDTVTIDAVTKPVDNYTHNKKYVFYNPIQSGSYMEGSLEWDDVGNVGVPKELVIYWYWPYEYKNLSEEIKTDIKLPEDSAGNADIMNNENRFYYFDKEKLKEMSEGKGIWNEIQLYDYADTRIGTYVEKIKIRLKVDGYHAREAEANPTE